MHDLSWIDPVDNKMSDSFEILHRIETRSPQPWNFALERAILKLKGTERVLTLKGLNLLFVYADSIDF